MSFKIIHQDSIEWLKEQKDKSIANFITGLPDLEELKQQYDLNGYLKFFEQVAELMFAKVTDDGYCIFIQTDRKFQGQFKMWISSNSVA